MRVFDVSWYRAQRPDCPAGIDGALDHFARVGARAWCSPSPLFDVAHYLRQAGREAFHCPYRHYENVGSAAGLTPHLLVDASSYRARRRLHASIEVLNDAAGSSDAPPLNPLFDREWYEKRRSKSFPSNFSAFADYVSVGQGRGIGPYPLFDPLYIEGEENFDPVSAFEKYWAHPQSFEPGTFPFLDSIFSKGAAHLAAGMTGLDGNLPITRLLDPFETAAESTAFSLSHYLSGIEENGFQELRASARALAHISEPLANERPAEAECWAPSPPLTSQSQQATAHVDILHHSLQQPHDAATIFVVGSGHADWAHLTQMLVELAGRPDVGLVGITHRQERVAGDYRQIVVPHHGPVAICRSALDAVGGLNEDFANLPAAMADMALRLAERGYCNLELNDRNPIPDTSVIVDAVDATLLFERHTAALQTFAVAEQLCKGASF